MRDWKIFQMPPAEVQQRQAELFDPYPMPGVAPIDPTVRPPGWYAPPPEATRGRWPAPGTFPRVRLPADTHVKYPEQRFEPPQPEPVGEPIPPAAARPQSKRRAQALAQPQPKRQAQSSRRTQPE